MARMIPLMLLLLFAFPNVNALRAEVGVAISSSDDKTEIAANMRQARHYMKKGDYVSAKKKLERVLELDEEHEEALRLLKVCNEWMEQQKKAEKAALNAAVESRTVKALEDFIAQYPKSEYVSQAESCIVDFNLWDKARQEDTKTAYQKYLNTSTIRAYKDEAEAAIFRIEAEEAWNDAHNSNSIPKLESFLKQYPRSAHEKEAEYEINLMKAEQYFAKNSRSLALVHYEKANAYRALTGTHLRCYKELLLEARYDELKGSNNLTDLQDFLKKLPPDSPYYNPISNRIAVIKAQRLTVNSSETDMDEALGYAKNDDTKSTVKNYIADIKKRQRENRRNIRRKNRKEWWEDRATLGWNMVTADMDPSFDLSATNSSAYPTTCSLGTGLRLRFGRYNDWINFTIGADYQNYWRKHVTYSGYYNLTEEIDYYTIYRRLAFPVNIKLNMPSESIMAFYFGCTAEFGFDFDYVLDYVMHIRKFEDFLDWQATPSIAIEPQIGFNHKHFDWGLYYRRYLDGYRFFDSDYSFGHRRLGIYMVVYF